MLARPAQKGRVIVNALLNASIQREKLLFFYFSLAAQIYRLYINR